jgi:Tfp pilus assembly protein PilO
MSNISKIVYIILTLVIAYIFIYPSVGEVSALTAEKQKYTDTLTMISNIENKKNELLTKFNNISATDRKDIETILPNSLDFVNLISQIDAVAAKYGISVDKVSSKETTSGNSGETISSQPYQSAIIGFSFDATYEKFNAFLNDLEKSLRILDIKSIKLTTKEDGIYTYNMEFQTHWLK